MGVFSTKDKALQEAALRAGLRTAEQTLVAGLGVGTIGGVAVGVTLDATGQLVLAASWKQIVIALATLIVTAFFAGVRSWFSIVSNGLPAQYKAAAASDAAAVLSLGEADADDLVKTLGAHIATPPSKAAHVATTPADTPSSAPTTSSVD